MEINQLWESVCQKLKEQVNDVLFNVWIEPLEPHSLVNGSEMIIIAPSQFHKDVIIDQHIGEKIEKAIYNTIGFEVTLRMLVKGEDIPAEAYAGNHEISWHDAVANMKMTNLQDNSSSEKNTPGQMYSSTGDSTYEYTFDTFSEHHKCEDNGGIPEPSDGEKINTKEIKLLAKLVNRLQRVYLRLSKAIRRVIFSDISDSLNDIDLRVISAGRRGVDVAERLDSLHSLAERLKSNIRQLEGVVKRINATYQLEKELPSLTMAQNAIRDVMNDVQPTPITIERIIEEVARTFEVTAS